MFSQTRNRSLDKLLRWAWTPDNKNNQMKKQIEIRKIAAMSELFFIISGNWLSQVHWALF